MSSSKIGVIDCGSGEWRKGEEAVPLFMRDGGEAILQRRGKELETYLKCLENKSIVCPLLYDKTIMFVSTQDVSIIAWWKQNETKTALIEFLSDKKNHKLGKIWNNGFLGSRWADTKINGESVRFAFYSKMSDAEMFASFPEQVKQGKDYAIIINPN